MRQFNSKEMDLFFAICAKMKEKSQSKIEFNFTDLKALSEYKMTATKAFTKDLENVYDKMLNLTYREEKSNGDITKFVLFTGFSIKNSKKSVEISINPDFEYILNELTREFTQFELREFTNLSSSYSKTMYRLLKQYKSTGFYSVKIEEFRELLDIPKSYRMSKINERILGPIQRELSQYFEPFTITKIKSKKKGNRIDRLEFSFREKFIEEDLPKVSLANWLENN